MMSEERRQSAAKKVALQLRGLSPGDRSWLLTRLSGEQRQQVMVAEQHLLRIIGDATLSFEQILSASHTSRPNNGEFKILALRPHSQVADLLDELPATWVAGIFHVSAWHGADQYLSNQGPSRRQAIQRGHLPLSHAACMALCGALEQKLVEA